MGRSGNTKEDKTGAASPGNWCAEPHIPRGSCDVTWRVVDEAGNVVAIVDPNDEAADARRNATMLAAAPRLLATLQDELMALRCWAATQLPNDVREGTAISTDKIERAITAAKETK